MGRLRVKDSRPSADDSRRQEVWKILQDHHCMAWKVYKAGNGFAITTDDKVIEEITKTTIKTQFSNHGFEVLDPPELNAKRTLVITQADSFVLSKGNDEIKNELERTKTGIKVTEVIRLPNASSIFKLKFESTQMVQKCLDEGILLFSQSFPPRNLNEDVYVSLPQCMRCYSYTHTKKDCPQPATYKICSNCSAVDHTYAECHSAFRKCVTCAGDHPTLAARCPTRRDMVKNKAKQLRDQSRIQSGTSYATVVVGNGSNNTNNRNNQTSSQAWQQPPKQQSIVINTALIQANIAEAASPGCFQQVLDDIYKANGLTPVIIPPSARATASINQMLNGNPGLNPNPNPTPNTGTTSTPAAQTPSSPTNVTINTTVTDEMECQQTNQGEKRVRENQSDSDSEAASPPSKHSNVAVTDDSIISISSVELAQILSAVPGDEAQATAVASTSGATAVEPVTTTVKVGGFKLYAAVSTGIPKVRTQAKMKHMLFNSNDLKFIFTENTKTTEEVEQLIIDDRIDLTRGEIAKVTKEKMKGGYHNLNRKGNSN